MLSYTPAAPFTPQTFQHTVKMWYICYNWTTNIATLLWTKSIVYIKVHSLCCTVLFCFETRSHYAAKAGLELEILLLQFSKCWNYRPSSMGFDECMMSLSHHYNRIIHNNYIDLNVFYSSLPQLWLQATTDIFLPSL
jgi:hypothetical protein